MQALSAWSLAVAGAAGAIAFCAAILAAVTSNRLAAQVRVGADAELAQAHARLAAASVAGAAADQRTANLERTKAVLEVALSRTAELGADPSLASDPVALERRALAFAALIRSRTPQLALIVGHGPGDHAAGVAMRTALKRAGVGVRWCRLKLGVSHGAERAPFDLAVYADPDGPHAPALVKALEAVGFRTQLRAAAPHDMGLPAPAIVFAGAWTPAARALATCNPVLTDARAHPGSAGSPAPESTGRVATGR